MSPRICHGLAPQTYTLSNVILGKYDIILFWYHYPFVVSISICHNFPFIRSLSISNQTKNLLWFSHTVHPEDREQDWTHHNFSFYSFQGRRGNRVRKAKDDGTSLVVQWLRLRVSNAGGTGLMPSQGTNIPQALRCSPHHPTPQKKRKKSKGWWNCTNRQLGSI